MGDGAHLRVRGGVAAIFWRQETGKTQAFACTAQQVSGEKMGSSSPAKALSTLEILTWADAPLKNVRSVASRPIRRGPAWQFICDGSGGCGDDLTGVRDTTFTILGQRA